MNGIKQSLSADVKRIVGRLFADEAYRDDALANPELAFEGYSLDEEERKALKSLMGRRSLFSTSTGPDGGFWV